MKVLTPKEIDEYVRNVLSEERRNKIVSMIENDKCRCMKCNKRLACICEICSVLNEAEAINRIAREIFEEVDDIMQCSKKPYYELRYRDLKLIYLGDRK